MPPEPRSARPGPLHRGRSVALIHTARLDAATLAAARALLDEAFDGEFGDADWEHALGGLHALAFEGTRLVAHRALVQRRMLHGGRALRCGYVEAVGVAADRRRQGLASAVMGELEWVIRRAYDLGGLSATDAGSALYLSRGWQLWTGPTSALTPSGTRHTPDDDGSVHVLVRGTELDLSAELTCDWRDGDVW
jgi:aminoglycoside 2'-N-acetyltransferase I